MPEGEHTLEEVNSRIAHIQFSEPGRYEIIHDLYAISPYLNRGERVFLYRIFLNVTSRDGRVARKLIFPGSSPINSKIHLSVSSGQTPFWFGIEQAEKTTSEVLRLKKFEVFLLN